MTTRVTIRPEAVARLRAGGSPFHAAVARQVELYPRFAETGSTLLHDPLAAALIVRRDLAEMVPVRVEVETQGRLSTGASLMRSPSSHERATAAVAIGIDAVEAERFVEERLAAPLAAGRNRGR